MLNKIIYVIIITLLLFSCSQSNINVVEKLLDVKLTNKIFFDNRIERWDEFQGDGFFIETYSIRERYVVEIEELIKKEGFIPLGDKAGDYLNSSDIKESIQEQEGYYKLYENKGEVKIIVYNNRKKQLIYYCILY